MGVRFIQRLIEMIVALAAAGKEEWKREENPGGTFLQKRPSPNPSRKNSHIASGKSRLIGRRKPPCRHIEPSAKSEWSYATIRRGEHG